MGSRYKIPRPSQEELQKRVEKPCKTCRWHASLNGNNVYIYCSYISKTGHARPCKPEECIQAGVYERQKRKEKPEYGRALDDYGLGEEDLGLVDELIEKIARDRERQEEEDEKIQ